MNAAALRERLAAAGLRLRIEGDDLALAGAMTALTPALMTQVEAARPALLALLREEEQEVGQGIHRDGQDEQDQAAGESPAQDLPAEPVPSAGGYPVPLDEWASDAHEHREALKAVIAHLPVEEQLVYLGYLQCRVCRRWLLIKEFEPDAQARPICRDRADCWEAARRAHLPAGHAHVGTRPLPVSPLPLPALPAELHLEV